MRAPEPGELRTRIEALYMEVEGRDTPHGALTWFAGEAGVSHRTVERWVHGDTVPGGPVLALLERMEGEQP